MITTSWSEVINTRYHCCMFNIDRADVMSLWLSMMNRRRLVRCFTFISGVNHRVTIQFVSLSSSSKDRPPSSLGWTIQMITFFWLKCQRLNDTSNMQMVHMINMKKIYACVQKGWREEEKKIRRSTMSAPRNVSFCFFHLFLSLSLYSRDFRSSVRARQLTLDPWATCICHRPIILARKKNLICMPISLNVSRRDISHLSSSNAQQEDVQTSSTFTEIARWWWSIEWALPNARETLT